MRGKKPGPKIVAIAEQPSKVPPFRLIGAYKGMVHADDDAFNPMTDKELVEYGFECMLDGELTPRSESK